MRSINQIYINGAFTPPHGTETADLFNPASAEKIGTILLGNEIDADLAIQAAKKAFESFSTSTLQERGEILVRLYNALIRRQDDLNAAAVLEYGSPISATKGRTQYSANLFLEAKQAMESFEFVKNLDHATIVNEPLGVIAAITPWNADYTHICGKLAPAIAAGCTVVIKPSELSGLQTQILTECFHEANVPPGVINIVNGTGPVVGAALAAHPDVAVITFTGSTAIGKLIRRTATETMKRVTLELGGKSPNIIFDDADLDKAIPMALLIAFSNSGQACHAGSRLIVPESKLEEVKTLLKHSMDKVKLGDPNNPDVYIGPMVSRKQFDTVQKYIQSGINEGAEVLVGGLGHPEKFGGYYVRPTIFVNVTSDFTIAKEEIFGPVLSVLTFKSEEEAIRIANSTVYGLSAYISSSDITKATAVAAKIISGRVLINTAINSEPKSPFGGFKQSGIGRTGWSYGINEYVEPKVLAIG